MIVYEDVNTLPKVSTVVYEVDNPIIDDELVEADDKEVLVVNEAEDIHEKNGVISLTDVSTGAGSLRVSKPKKHETLESTWKTMTDRRHIPLNRHLKKSDTFENHNQHEPKLDYNAMKKLETFNDRTDEVTKTRVVTTEYGYDE
nr:RNA-directed DNA polymerase, eukaryota, reverse transcriptase zinc-binding domain protein [Tanacetum cinerariifolium]